MKSFGGIIFVAGLVLAAIIAVFSAAAPPAWAVFVLAVIGLIVGIINITEKETMLFLVSSVAFLISFSSLSAVFTILALGWEAVSVFFGLMNVFVAPAAAVVAIKAIFRLSKD